MVPLILHRILWISHYGNSAFQVGAGTIAVTWSKKTLGYLHVSEDFNLYQQLMVLLDTKYKRPEDYDQAWTDAFNEAKFTLEQLIEEANNSKKEADALVVALLKVFAAVHFRLY